MIDQSTVERLNAQPPKFLQLLNGRVAAADAAAQTCTMTFDVSRDFCHSGDIIQGGFITSMLDATMSHTAFGVEGVMNVATLELKVSFLEVSRAGSYRAEARIIKATHRTAFFEAQLYNSVGLLTATSSAVAKLVRTPS